MKKKILSIILATLMLISSLPLSVLAEGLGELLSRSSVPVVSVESKYSYFKKDTLPEEFYRALPDDEGVFYFDITVDKAPTTDEEIRVYYRTVDETAVAAWGDYEDVGAFEEAYVTLNKANGYRARVQVNSTVLDYASRGGDGGTVVIEDGALLSRRFIFELTRVDGNAVLHQATGTSGTIQHRSKSKLYCYLKAKSYIHQTSYQMGEGYPLRYPSDEPPMLTLVDQAINTAFIYGDKTVSSPLNFEFPQHFKTLMKTGNYNLNISVFGLCKEDYMNDDGPVTLDLYYTYQGKKMKAFSLTVEGEFDDSLFFGFEHAYDYINDTKTDKGFDIKDHINDNFYGFSIYDNDGNVEYRVSKDQSRDVDDIVKALRNSIIDGYATKLIAVEDLPLSKTNIDNNEMTVLRLPSNFINADSYSWELTTIVDNNSHGRRLEDVVFAFAITEKYELKILEDEKGNQMVTTNIDTMRDGDKLQFTVRLNQLAMIESRRGPNTITAKINGLYEVTLTNKHPNIYPDLYDNYLFLYAWDTFVFEGDLPPELNGIRITSLTDIKWTYNGGLKDRGPKTFLKFNYLLSNKIHDIYGYNRDLRVPLATPSIKGTDTWTKSKSLDIYVNTVENGNSRFNDYAAVYYQWSDSPELPATYSSRVDFHTHEDGEIFKTIIGTGDGEMYLHIKTVSGYGKSSISDAVTGYYDPSDASATYTPFGPFKFDNSAPEFSASDITIGGNLRERTITMLVPDDGGTGVKELALYYVGKSGQGVKLKTFTDSDFTGDPKRLSYTISHKNVGVAVDENGNAVLGRGEVEFYWILTDKLGNTSGKIAEFTLTFDTHDYISDELVSARPHDMSTSAGDAQFVNTTATIDEFTFIYDYSLNKDKTFATYAANGKTVYYAFAFAIDPTKLEGGDGGTYSANVSYKGDVLHSAEYSVEEITDNVYAVLFYGEMDSGRYDIQLKSSEGGSERVSRIYSVYATDSEDDRTSLRDRIETGTLLTNSVYQLSAEYPYFYYKDKEGVIKKTYYNDSKQPATFSTLAKVKEYVLYKELGDIYLVELTAATASALNSGTTGYLIAKGETQRPQAGQWWIRYKSDSWTPTSGDTSWVYYYYGMSGDLSYDALSANLLAAISAVSNRIVGYGKSLVLTDASLFLDSVSGDRLLDEYGMPYLTPEQIHNADELSDKTMCGNVWGAEVAFAADRNIYKSNVSVGEEGTANYAEYPLVGNFKLPEGSIIQYKTFGGTEWLTLDIKKDQIFIEALRAVGSYGVNYIRELSADGVAVYAVYVDKEAPKVTFSQTDNNGNMKEIPVDGAEILDIRTKDLYIGRVSAVECDRLSYVAVYRVSNLSLVGIYTAQELENAPVKLDDGNYYIIVADRSGNCYTVTAKVSSSDLECTVKESNDKFIRLTCNRRVDQILRYEVYLNGELVTSTYSPDQTFDKAGIYNIYVQDIYGNEFSDEYVFSRNYPTVTWRYLSSDGRYHLYDPKAENNEGFVMTYVSDNQYKISTSVKTRFSFSDGYEYKFEGTPPKHTETFGTETVVTIEAGQSFTLRVYYKNHKDCYTVYTGAVDVTPPTINVTADVDVLKKGEFGLFEEWIKKGAVTMDDLYYQLVEVASRPVSNGARINSDIIRINASDANELSSVEVYLDGELIKQQDTTSGFTQIIVSRWGSYRVVAKDTLGNVSETAFTNGNTDGVSYFVDGEEAEIALHGYLNFKTVGKKHVYTKVDYGNTDFRLNITQNADVFMSVGVSGSANKIYGFRISDGSVYPITYTVKNGAVDLTVGQALIDTASKEFKVNREYVITKNASCDIYASVDAYGAVSIKVYAPEDDTAVVSVSARVDFGESDISFVCAELSHKTSDIYFVGDGAQTETDIRANNGFTVNEAFFEIERIESVSLYYSKLNDLKPDSLEDRTDIYYKGDKYTDEGFYLLIVRNLYGNDKVYRITIMKTFGVTSSVTFADGYQIYYSKDHTGTLYSNGSITIDLFDEDVTVDVTLNGAVYTGFVQDDEDNVIYLVFSEEGKYVVRLTDSYKNEITKELEINRSAYKVADELLVGYNEKALRRDEGYTNQMLSIDKAVFDREGIYYLAVGYGDDHTVLFDSFSETPVSTEDSALKNIIGSKGDGVYTVTCRNRFGAVVTKDIHYRSTPTLKLERTTRSQSKPEIYDLSHAIKLGFWSNNALAFSTDAQVYVFKINGNVTECPRTLVFEHAGDYGNFEYDITYIDEYGFEYSFKAYLVRKEVTVNVPSSLTGTMIDGVLNTKNDVAITFGENIYATYTRNNGEEIIYHSGDVLKMDGTYRFTVIDYAGNSTAITIKKDTAVEFSFTESVSGTTVLNGGVVNSSKVSFNSLNKDSAYIEKVTLNGVVQDNTASTKFTEDGKWELIVSDKLGNKSYFCFYIITRSQNGFSYTTPYEYRITEMWYDAGDGVEISYMSFIEHTEYNSSFKFVENGKYSVVMTSDVTGKVSTFEFNVNTNAPEAYLVGCNPGETTINDITVGGCKVGDRIKIYKLTDSGERLIADVSVASLSTQIPTVTEGGKYRIVVESEAGVATEFTFTRKHVMNTAGSVFVMVVIGLATVSLVAGLVYRNKSKTDE